jgi:putative transposase
MSYHQVALHFVWATKYREKILSPEMRRTLFKHVQEYCKSKDIWQDFIGGYTDHVHLLIWLQPKQSFDSIANLIKGESAYWFNNKSNFHYQHLSW